MKVEMFTRAKPEPKKVLVALAYRHCDKTPYLEAVDEYGYHRPSGFLAKITPAGIELVECVNPDLGFPLDSAGCLKVVNSDW